MVENRIRTRRDYVSDVLDEQFFRPVINDYLNRVLSRKGKEVYKLELVTKFPKIDFSQFDLKAQGIAYYRDRGILTIRESRLLANQDPYPEDQAEVFDKIQKALMENPDIADSIIAMIDSQPAAKNPNFGPQQNDNGDPTASGLTIQTLASDPNQQRARQQLEGNNQKMVKKMARVNSKSDRL